MPADRYSTLRRAEQLLREGSHALAIEEYLRVLEDQPGDWGTVNALGDLYIRDSQPGKAVEQFVRSADGLFADGFVARAAATYRKALRVDPLHEHALARLAEALSAQGLIAEARAYLEQAIAACLARGDRSAAGRLESELAVLGHVRVPDPNPEERVAARDPGEGRIPPNPHLLQIEDVDVVADVDLEVVDLKAFSPVPAPPLEDVFAAFREEAAVDASSGSAEAALARGLARQAAGQIDASIPDLEWAARAPQLRFEAASCLARAYRDRGQLHEAVEWFERAAEAPAPTEAAGHRLLYELAGALEAARETARALAVYLELQIAAGTYLDVAERANRLAVTAGRD